VKSIKLAAAICAALLGMAAIPADASPSSYHYILTGPGPDGTLDFTLNADPTFGNNVSKVTAFDINLYGIDFTQLNGTLARLDFVGSNLVNIVYGDNLPNLTFGTALLGYVYNNRLDHERGAGVILGGRVAHIPEPASLALMLSGLGLIGVRRRRAK
jgi:hypothetical protein